jgi:hypothetical protein
MSGRKGGATAVRITEATGDSATSVISLKVTLKGIRPPIWRRLLVPGAMTFGDLHHAIQAAMGWMDGHLHVFDIGGQQYGDPHAVDDVTDEKRLTLNSMMKSGVTRFDYTYDFGDDWEHLITIEKTKPAPDGKSCPACVGGARSCPPEDCGGIWGYQHLLEVLADPDHPDYDEQIEWVSDDFDPEEFVLERANARVAAWSGKVKRTDVGVRTLSQKT